MVPLAFSAVSPCRTKVTRMGCIPIRQFPLSKHYGHHSWNPFRSEGCQKLFRKVVKNTLLNQKKNQLSAELAQRRQHEANYLAFGDWIGDWGLCEYCCTSEALRSREVNSSPPMCRKDLAVKGDIKRLNLEDFTFVSLLEKKIARMPKKYLPKAPEKKIDLWGDLGKPQSRSRPPRQLGGGGS